MIGVLLVTHSRLGEELIKTAEFIVGRLAQSRSLSLDPGQSVESLRSQIQEAIRSVDDGDGVIILVDMLGGTPSNLSLSFLEQGQVEVITGANLPMLLKLSQRKEGMVLGNLAEEAMEAGLRSISLASKVLYQKPNQKQ
ncbi:MAG: PTS fructose transporter subunit IIA [Deltaproteobacteria bacterium]|nr:PTS fructose transporter subunit IIA [Deltaproteobacteria bacterium]